MVGAVRCDYCLVLSLIFVVHSNRVAQRRPLERMQNIPVQRKKTAFKLCEISQYDFDKKKCRKNLRTNTTIIEALPSKA